MVRRILGREPPPNFTHLPNIRFTPFDGLKGMGENLAWAVTNLPKLWRKHRRHQP